MWVGFIFALLLGYILKPVGMRNELFTGLSAFFIGLVAALIHPALSYVPIPELFQLPYDEQVLIIVPNVIGTFLLTWIASALSRRA